MCIVRTDLQSLSPNPKTLLELNEGAEVRGVIVTLQGDLHQNRDNSRGAQEYNFISRYFAPWVGIPEDPVTGNFIFILFLFSHKIYKFQCFHNEA